MSPARWASIPWTAAASPCTVVMHGMFRATAALRISYPSIRGDPPWVIPIGVLTIRFSSPSWTIWTIVGSPFGPGPCELLRTVTASTPLRRRTSAVPSVA
jgi:hypothetical protein